MCVPSLLPSAYVIHMEGGSPCEDMTGNESGVVIVSRGAHHAKVAE